MFANHYEYEGNLLVEFVGDDPNDGELVRDMLR